MSGGGEQVEIIADEAALIALVGAEEYASVIRNNAYFEPFTMADEPLPPICPQPSYFLARHPSRLGVALFGGGRFRMAALAPADAPEERAREMLARFVEDTPETDAVLHLPCLKTERAEWMRKAGGAKLHEWVRSVLNKAPGR